MSRFPLYAALSTVAVAAVVYHAQQTRVQFYPTVVYLTTSKLAVMVLGNAALVLTLMLGKLMKLMYLGRISPAEYDVRCTSTHPFRRPATAR